MFDRQPYCNRASTRWYTLDKQQRLTTQNPLNKRNSRTHYDGLERSQANSYLEVRSAVLKSARRLSWNQHS
jgi:hypothetical protein